MENLFDLNDYDDVEDNELKPKIEEDKVEIKSLDKIASTYIEIQTKEQVPRKKTDDGKNLYQIQHKTVEKKDDNLSNVNIYKPMSEIKKESEEAKVDKDDSFELELNTKITMNKNKNIIGKDGKDKIKHAVDDTIDIKEYDKIPEIAMKFPFELDVFQKRSILRLENHQVKLFLLKLECFSLCSH